MLKVDIQSDMAVGLGPLGPGVTIALSTVYRNGATA